MNNLYVTDYAMDIELNDNFIHEVKVWMRLVDFELNEWVVAGFDKIESENTIHR